MKEALVLIFALLLICAPASIYIGQGVGTAIESDANQRALDGSQQRAQQQTQFERQEREQEEISPYRVAAWQNAWYWLSLAAIVAGATVLISGGLSFGWWSFNFAQARVEVARREAYILRLDPHTRQFPLLTYTLAGHHRVYNPNTGSVVSLGEARPEVPMLVTGSAAVQLAGALAEKSAPEGVADIRPPLIVEPKDRD